GSFPLPSSPGPRSKCILSTLHRKHQHKETNSTFSKFTYETPKRPTEHTQLLQLRSRIPLPLVNLTTSTHWSFHPFTFQIILCQNKHLFHSFYFLRSVLCMWTTLPVSRAWCSRDQLCEAVLPRGRAKAGGWHYVGPSVCGCPRPSIKGLISSQQTFTADWGGSDDKDTPCGYGNRVQMLIQPNYDSTAEDSCRPIGPSST
ncbi:hypothetical protein ILYODFUR_020631, partial [Ilyodon furcidens]